MPGAVKGDADWGVVLVASARFGPARALAEWQLARAMARRRPVLYVEPPTFLHRAPAERARPWPAVRAAAPGLHVLRPVAPPGADRARWASIGDVVIDRQIERAADRHLPDRRVIVTAEPRRGTLAGVRRDALVYWQRDRVGASSTVRNRDVLLARHAALAASADLVLGVSPALLDDVAGVARRTVVLPNGCDVDHFGSACSRDRRDGEPVTVGYAGGISWRVDVELLAHVADARPEWDVVLIGDVECDVPARPNLHPIGRRAYADLPCWFRRFDVGLVPYRLDDFNVASFPLKVYEYLAAGCPVVSTALPALNGLDPHVRTAADPDAFVAAIDVALDDGPDPSSCRAVAAANSWDVRAAVLDEHLAALVSTSV